MCGIAGILNFNGSPVSEELLLQMGKRMSHRGPDDHGLFKEKGLGFVHQRLSILDLSLSGHQPMFNEDRSLVIIYNGECYNYRTLRDDLISKGYRFKSGTDTEVILYGFEEYGPRFVERMNGMFSFAIWSSKNQELFLFRDRLGIKPLYFSLTDERLVFASEVKPLLEAGVPSQLDTSQLSSFFSLRYVPGPQTLFAGIQKQVPGTWMRFQADGRMEAETYWSVLTQESLLPLNEKEAQEKFYSLFSDAVEENLIADVPVGAFLSGGIDSALISALMKKSKSEVETFTFGVGSGIDETERAMQVAKQIDVRNTVVRLQSDDFRYYPLTIWHLEEPIGDSIIVPTYLLAKAASQKVKVIELGEGADEILGGYVHQLAMTYGNLLMKLVPAPLRKVGASFFEAMPERMRDRFFPYPAKLGKSGVQKVIQYIGNNHSAGSAYLSLVGLFSEEEKKLLFKKDLYHEFISQSSPTLLFENFFQQSKNPVFKNQLQQLDLRYWNTDYGMVRMDKLTMAHSVEARVPYLDHRLVELCLRLPRKFKTKRFKQKLLMRKAFHKKGVLPDDVIWAPKKSFYLPVENCFDSKFESFVKDTLSDQAIQRRGLFNLEYVRSIRDNSRRELIHNKQLFSLFCFELWAQQFLDGAWREKPGI